MNLLVSSQEVTLQRLLLKEDQVWDSEWKLNGLRIFLE